MVQLDELAPGMLLRGIRPQMTVIIVAVTRHSADSAEIVYKDVAGVLGTELLYRDVIEQLGWFQPNYPGHLLLMVQLFA